MLQRFFLSSLALALLASLSVGCLSDVEKTATEKVTHPAIQAANEKLGGYSGGWSGTWRSPDGHDHPLRATFKQDGLSVTGTLTFEKNPCIPSAELHAAVVDDGLDAELRAGDLRLHYDVTYFDGSSMEGQLTAIGPALCAVGEGGSALFHLDRD
jgi:hypothetical protein